jgi:hypothetical protein
VSFIGSSGRFATALSAVAAEAPARKVRRHTSVALIDRSFRLLSHMEEERPSDPRTFSCSAVSSSPWPRLRLLWRLPTRPFTPLAAGMREGCAVPLLATWRPLGRA